VASDEIYRALQRVDKPVVVSMGSIAASGGYYISVAADHIYATPYTLTGSIGVISQFFNAQELLEDLGVEVITITSGEVKDFGNFARPMTEEERAYWQALIDDTYEGFLSIVAEGRSLPVDEVREIADGRVILGGDAVELGLVDELGYFEDAVAKAAELGGIEGEPRIVELKPQTGLFESLYGLESLMRRSEVLDLLQRTGAPPSLEFRYAAP
ncbi:MAG TPA: signal peptide peptidase SppA, partial [Aggregatilineales bacterium]|nr:signal peptide peptidase SppA [Aggregatilineales bacterium]